MLWQWMPTNPVAGSPNVAVGYSPQSNIRQSETLCSVPLQPSSMSQMGPSRLGDSAKVDELGAATCAVPTIQPSPYAQPNGRHVTVATEQFQADSPPYTTPHCPER